MSTLDAKTSSMFYANIAHINNPTYLVDSLLVRPET